MPIHDYHCRSCGSTYEKLVFPGDIVDCPVCGSTDFRLLMSIPAVKSDCGDNSYPYVEENIGPKPITLESPSHRRRVMKEHGLTDLGTKPGLPGQWI